jgi:[lysine-biosynthesis-protein LysW]---L-2-aminoadipate ligase
MRIALLHSRIRVEEKLLADELSRRGIDHDVIDVRQCVFDIHDPAPWRRFDAVIERCISETQALAVVRVLEAFSVPCVNPSEVIEACGNKLTTSLRLARAGVPTPRVLAAVDDSSALNAVERMGYRRDRGAACSRG